MPTVGDTSWAVTVGEHGVFFRPAPGNPGSVPPDVAIVAILPDDSELIPSQEGPNDDGISGTHGFVFDRPLPEGSVVYMNGSVLHTVGHER